MYNFNQSILASPDDRVFNINIVMIFSRPYRGIEISKIHEDISVWIIKYKNYQY